MPKEKRNKINRRNFLKTVGAAGLGSVFCSARTKADTNKPDAIDPNAHPQLQMPKFPQVPKRKLSKRIDIEVSSLALGTMFNLVENQIILKKAFQWGVTYWDTAHVYAGGNSELGIGKFLKKNPEVRKKIFLVSKASLFGPPRTIENIEKRLQESLKSLNTSYIDLYYGVHDLRDLSELSEELKQWAESAKKRKLIRFFGFSAHSNVAKYLAAAAKLDWIDGILAKYNFRMMKDQKTQAAIQACYKAGIGLTAMKTQGKKIETDDERKLTEHFLNRGFTEGQAKLKAVLQDKRFGSVASGMGSVALLTTNVAAALDKTKLTVDDMNVLTEYAKETCSGYCAGCSDICDEALPNTPYVSDIMRYLMYYNSYGERERAKQLFTQIPADTRSRLLNTDYSRAQALCPQHLPIGRFVAEAVNKLA